MEKKFKLRKLSLYFVLFLGIILSVVAYFYTKQQVTNQWKNNLSYKIDFAFAETEKKLIFDILDEKSNINLNSDLKKLKFKDSFSAYGFLSPGNRNIVFTDKLGKRQSLNISSSQVEKLIKGVEKYDYYFFNLDSVNNYVIIKNNQLSDFVIFRITPNFKWLLKYSGYHLKILDQSGDYIYEYKKESTINDYLTVSKKYEVANTSVLVEAFVDPDGIDGVGKYDVMFMILIMLITAGIASFIFIQNITLNKFNSKLSNQSERLRFAYDMFRNIAGNSFDMIAIINSDLKIEYANEAYHNYLKYNLNSVKGVNILELVPDSFKDRLEYNLRHISQTRRIEKLDLEIFHSNKKDKIAVEAIIEGFFNSEGNVTSYALHCKDVTSKKESLKALLQSKRRFKDFADSSADWLWESDENLRFSFVSTGVEKSVGVSSDKLMGKKIKTLFQSDLLVSEFLKERTPIKDVEVKAKNLFEDDNKARDVFLRISAVPVYRDHKGFIGYRGVARDISAQKLEQERVIELATVDPLTGVLNRSAFMAELEKIVKFSLRNGMTGVLVFIDLDMFKYINDSHGFQAGDKVLHEIAALLKENLRNTDVIGRVGGDEFAIIMQDIAVKEARRKIKSVLDNLTKLKVKYKGEDIQVTCSMGVIAYPSDGQEVTQLLTSAVLAMHKAKEMGRNRVYMLENSFRESDNNVLAKEKLRRLSVLRRSLEKNDFEMYYQPIVPIKKGSPVIFESLLRIRNENNVIDSPIFYVEAAESFGLAQTLDISVLRKTIRYCKKIQDENKQSMFSINISGLSLGDDNVLKALKAIVKEEGPDTSRIVIEVTETAAMRDEQRAKKFVADLHALGFKFALDDFGSGYSSFYYLKNLDVDYVKIDGEYIKNIDESKENKFFVKALTELAKGLGIKVIVEFVEKESHVDILRKLGVDYLQGYYISKPIDGIEEAISRFDEVNVDEI